MCLYLGADSVLKINIMLIYVFQIVLAQLKLKPRQSVKTAKLIDTEAHRFHQMHVRRTTEKFYIVKLDGRLKKNLMKFLIE